MQHFSVSATTWKLLYLLALAILLFVRHDPQLLLALLGLQGVLWFASRLPARGLWRVIWRLRLFFIIILLSYLFMGTGLSDEWLTLPFAAWHFSISLTGLQFAGLMCLRVLILVLASAWLQQSAPVGALVQALTKLRLPQSLAVTVDAILALVGDDRRQQGGKRGAGKGGKRNKKQGPKISFAQIRSGDLSFVTNLLQTALQRARDYLASRYPDFSARQLHDLSIVLAVGITIMGLKVLQVLPGVPIASGHKNLLIVPLLLFASSATHSRFGGLLAGSATGIVSVMLGYGKYGIFEIAHFAVPGLLADLLMPLAWARNRGGQLFQFIVFGILMGLGRFAANLLVIVLAGAPGLAFAFFAPMLVSQITFGALSCFVSILIVKNSVFFSGVDNNNPQSNDISS